MIKERGQGGSAEKGIIIPVEFPDVRHNVDIKGVMTPKNRATLARVSDSSFKPTLFSISNLQFLELFDGKEEFQAIY